MENFSDSIAVMYWPPFSGQRLSVNTIIDPGVFLMDSPWNLETHPYREKVEITKKTLQNMYIVPILCQNRQNIYGISITKLGSLQLRDQLRNFSRLRLAALAAVEIQVTEDSSDTHDFKHRKSP